MKAVVSPWVIGLTLAASLAGCGKKAESAKAEQSKPSNGSGNPLTAPVDYLGAVGAAQKHAQKVADLVPLQQAVQAFLAGEDRLPAHLGELVTEGYLPRLPDVPRGSRLEYNPRTGQVRMIAAPVSAPAPANLAPTGARPDARR